jgi:hypothetical protein
MWRKKNGLLELSKKIWLANNIFQLEWLNRRYPIKNDSKNLPISEKNLRYTPWSRNLKTLTKSFGCRYFSIKVYFVILIYLVSNELCFRIFFLKLFYIKIQLRSFKPEKRKTAYKSEITWNFDIKFNIICTSFDAQLNFIKTLLTDLVSVRTFLLYGHSIEVWQMLNKFLETKNILRNVKLRGPIKKNRKLAIRKCFELI